MLGGMVGRDSAKIRDWAKDEVKQLEPLIQHLLHKGMPSQVAINLLRSVATARVSFMIGVTSPYIIQAQLKSLDELFLNALITKLKLPSSLRSNQLALNQLRMPLRHGGLGIKSMITLGKITYYSNLIQSLPAIAHLRSAAERASDGTPLSLTLSSLHQDLLNLHMPTSALIPRDPKLLWTTHTSTSAPAKKIQTLITRAIDLHIHNRVLATATPEDKARLLSASNPAATIWLRTLPTEPALVLRNEQFTSVVSLLLNIKGDGVRCLCTPALVDPTTHFHTCPRFRHRAVIVRHDELVRTLIKIANEAGCTTQVEPQYSRDDPSGEASGNLRPDGTIHFPTSTVYVDVSVLHPSAPSHVTLAARGKLKSCAAREQSKISKYAAFAAQHHASIVPAVMESYGAMGSLLVKLLKRIAKTAVSFNPNRVRYGQFLARAYALLSVALMKGNARVAMEGGLLARTGTWRI